MGASLPLQQIISTLLHILYILIIELYRTLYQKYTNERLFVQYGFSMSGNPNDDVFPVPADSETASTSTSTSSTRDSLHDPNRDSERSLPAALLGGVDAEGEVEVEVVVGVEVEVKSSRSDAESGSMSSILQAADRIRATNRASGSSDADATPMQLHSVSRSLLRKIVQRSVSRQQSESASKDRNVLVEESTRSLLLSLLEEVQTLRAGYPSSLGEDSSLLLSVQSGTGPLVVVPSRTASAAVSSAVSGVNSDSTSTSTAEESSAVMLNRAQLEACIRQRIERKQLLLCAHNVLNEALSALNA